MSKISFVSFFKTFFVKGSLTIVFFIGLAVCCSSVADAKICFLPGGKCPGEVTADSVKAVQGDQCLGYNLTQRKCKDQACEDGWVCESCVNAQGTFYKCTKKETPDGYTPGLEKCDSPCQRYTWDGFSGNKINGKCEDIENFTAVKPNPCRTYIAPDYVCGVIVDGAEVSELTKDNDECTACYTNITEMSGYTTTKPASCTTYNSRRNGLQTSFDTMCYTTGTSIGDYFSTAERDNSVFVVETKSGVDTFINTDGSKTSSNTEACHRATGCNEANGWLPANDVDGVKFEYLEKTSDGITCRKAIACKASNNWFNKEKLGQFKDLYFATQEETRSGLTCYNAIGCHIRAYSYQPDVRYFTSDKKTSNGRDCWIVTGKAEYAYYAEDKKVDYFAYDGGQEAYLNGTDEIVRYYLADSCSQYSYDTQPDSRYFTFNSETRKQSGTNRNLTCWIITGKGDYAYGENEKVPGFFAYDAGKQGYLNGTSATVKYFDVISCNTPYSYSSEPDARYFSYTSETRKQGGINKDITCWNITGKGEFAYTESEKKTKFFTYDGGKTGYLNGTSTSGQYFDITSCDKEAYSSEPDKTLFSSVSDTKKKDGVNVDITCWNAENKGKFGSGCLRDSDCGYSSDSKLYCYNGKCHECKGEGSSCRTTGGTSHKEPWNGVCRSGECVYVDSPEDSGADSDAGSGCTPGNGKFGSVCCSDSDCGYSSDSKLHCYSGKCYECTGEGSSCRTTGGTAHKEPWNGVCRSGECVYADSAEDSGANSRCTPGDGKFGSVCCSNSDCGYSSESKLYCYSGKCCECTGNGTTCKTTGGTKYKTPKTGVCNGCECIG